VVASTAELQIPRYARNDNRVEMAQHFADQYTFQKRLTRDFGLRLD